MNTLKQIKTRCAQAIRPATILTAMAFVCAFLFCAFTLPALPPHDEVITGYQAVRLHVLANSDSEIDQSVKLEVRDAVNTLLSAPLQRADNRDEALETLKTNLEEKEEEFDIIFITSDTFDSGFSDGSKKSDLDKILIDFKSLEEPMELGRIMTTLISKTNKESKNIFYPFWRGKSENKLNFIKALKNSVENIQGLQSN